MGTEPEAVVSFYNVHGLLVRGQTPVRGRSLDVWDGMEWRPYTDIDAVLRYGHRLSEEDALALLCAIRDRKGPLPPLSEQLARAALRTPGLAA
jgi:hypothetical protein